MDTTSKALESNTLRALQQLVEQWRNRAEAPSQGMRATAYRICADELDALLVTLAPQQSSTAPLRASEAEIIVDIVDETLTGDARADVIRQVSARLETLIADEFVARDVTLAPQLQDTNDDAPR